MPVLLQVSVVQLLPSLQFGAAPAVQVPDWQLSSTVQPLLSALQSVPLALSVQAVLLLVLHCSHWFEGLVVPVV